MTKLANDLLLLTKLDQQFPVEKNKENINDIIQELSAQLKLLVGERTLELQLKNKLLALVNHNQIKQVILNLVNNAVQYTDKKQGHITISTQQLDSSYPHFVVLQVKDNGSGISPQHLPEIFDRFFRSDIHRSRKYGGYGLGLAIVKSIIDAHDGKVEVTSHLGLGTTFSIILKQAK